MFKQINDIIKEVSEANPEIDKTSIEDIIRSQFEYLKSEIESNNFNNIKLNHLGKFWIGKKGQRAKDNMEVFKKTKEIFQGWKNNYFRDNPEIEEEAKRRLDICSQCKLISQGKDIVNQTTIQKLLPDNFFCDQEKYDLVKGIKVNGCSCPLDQKSRSKESKCPLNKWEEENEQKTEE